MATSRKTKLSYGVGGLCLGFALAAGIQYFSSHPDQSVPFCGADDHNSHSTLKIPDAITEQAASYLSDGYNVSFVADHSTRCHAWRARLGPDSSPRLEVRIPAYRMEIKAP